MAPPTRARPPSLKTLSLEAKPVIGGLLVQDRDAVTETREQMRVVSAATPSEEQWEDMLFAWRICRHVRSNAIVIAAGQATIGIGAGQMSRVDAVRIAVEKAREFQPERLAGSVLASDAYFPFPDGPQLAIDAGVGAIIQPAGSSPRRAGRRPPSTPPASRWSRPACGTSGTERLRACSSR